MAEPESILQLGIEAAREGNRAEARNLFRLLTRQAPDDPQGWLWLAGVAADREERLAALKRVTALDPDNALAAKALQAMGSAPGPLSQAAEPAAAVQRSAAEPPALQPTTALRIDDWSAEAPEELPDLPPMFAPAPVAANAANAVTDVRDSGDLQRALPPLPALDAGLTDDDDDAAAPQADQPRPSWFPRTRPSTLPAADYDDDEADEQRRPFPLLLAVVAVAAVIVIGIALALLPELIDGTPRPSTVVMQPSSAATVTAGGGGATLPTAPPLPTVAALPTMEPTAVVEPSPTVIAVQPTADPATAAPELAALGTTLSDGGWDYTFPLANYALPLGPNVNGAVSRNGTYVLVLMLVANSTGSDQVLPETFVVLKDAQGRVWNADIAASAAYTAPGVNADVSMSIPIPSNGVTTSVAVLFDVATDATDLVLFAPNNPTSGWLVLAGVQ